MCEERNKTKLECDYQNRVIKVDSCIVPDIVGLWNIGVKTLGSCCGHGKYKKTIIVQSESGLLSTKKDSFKIKYLNSVEDVFTNTIIPRKRKFYKKDAKGYYYIPEIEAEK